MDLFFAQLASDDCLCSNNIMHFQMAANTVTRNFQLVNPNFEHFMKQSIKLLYSEDVAFTPNEYLDLIHIMIQNTFSGDIFQETLTSEMNNS